MRECLEVIEDNEIGLFVVVIGGVESVMTTKELMKIVGDIKVECVDMVRCKIVGKMLGKNVEVEVI